MQRDHFSEDQKHSFQPRDIRGKQEEVIEGARSQYAIGTKVTLSH